MDGLKRRRATISPENLALHFALYFPDGRDIRRRERVREDGLQISQPSRCEGDFLINSLAPWTRTGARSGRSYREGEHVRRWTGPLQERPNLSRSFVFGVDLALASVPVADGCG